MPLDSILENLKWCRKKVYLYMDGSQYYALFINKGLFSTTAKVSICNFCCAMSKVDTKPLIEIAKLIEDKSMVSLDDKTNIMNTFDISEKSYTQYVEMFNLVMINQSNKVVSDDRWYITVLVNDIYELICEFL